MANEMVCNKFPGVTTVHYSDNSKGHFDTFQCSAVWCSAVQCSAVQYSVVQSCIICELFLVPGKVVSVTSYWFIWPLWSVHYTKLYLLYSTITISVTVY